VVPRSALLYREFEIPDGAPEEIERMARYQLERDLPMPISEVRWGYALEREGCAPGRVRVRAAVIRTSDWAAMEQALRAKGIQPRAAVPSTECIAAVARDGAAACALPDGVELVVVRAGKVVGTRWVAGADAVRVGAEWTRTAMAAGWEKDPPPLQVFAPPEVRRAWAEAGIALNGAARTPEEAFAAAPEAAARGPDLLAPPARTPFARKYRLQIAAAAAAVVLLAGAGVARFHLSSVRAERRDVQRQLSELEKPSKEVDALEMRWRLARQWKEDRVRWHSVFAAVARALGPVESGDRGVYIMQLAVSVGARGRGAMPQWRIQVSGAARDIPRAQRFREALAELPGFGQVSALRNQTQEGRPYPVTFSVEAVVDPAAWEEAP
jgi:Tfp pilus assembly protein PilN